jgi:tetratricopeptide (TPR) repeat protein
LAQREFEQSIKFDPNNAGAYANLGFFAVERGDTPEGERLLRRALELEPDNYPATYDLGRLFVRLRRYDEAVKLLKRGAEMNKEDPGVHYQLFLTYSRQNAKPDADRELALFKSLEEARKSREAGSGMADSTKNQLPAPESAGSVSSKQRPQL